MPPVLAPRDRFEGYTIRRVLHASSRSHVHLATDDEVGTAGGAQAAFHRPARRPRYLDRFLLGSGCAPHRQSGIAQGLQPPGRASTCSW